VITFSDVAILKTFCSYCGNPFTRSLSVAMALVRLNADRRGRRITRFSSHVIVFVAAAAAACHGMTKQRSIVD
jgi:hypothetical protein